MQDIYEKMGLFYLGKNAEDEDLTLYKSKHLTTHAMLIGMTGSGKTGLGVGLIEEAAIDNIPSIIIDPKGDMANLCLSFPKLDADSFKPWLENPDDAQKTAQMWKNGIESAHQDVSRVQKFADVEKTIYTPGSSAGVSVNILGSFEAPSQEVLEDSDTLASLINATVSSLLSLLGIKSDSLNSQENLLLSNIFYHYYSQGISLSLEDIIGNIASPPFDKIGLFSLKTFYPQDERMKLAMQLNGLISSISFSSWIQGEALDIQKMLYDENGNAKVAIFSIAHLNDKERMFFVTILLNSYINWMRKQRGNSSLKNILYMDEIFGFFPPSKNPPSKKPMLLLLKQARAFGTGVILSTQNPIDLDYKGLSNIGTWFVGKLQTAQDIAKVVDPLSAKSKLTKKEISHKLSTLKGRHFFMKNVHSDETIEFSTRWVLSYLKGPMTKDDIKILMKDKKTKSEHVTKSVEVVEKPQKKSTVNSINKQIISSNIKEYFSDLDINSSEVFSPSLYASAEVRFYNQKRSIDKVEKLKFKLPLDSTTDILSWEDAIHALDEKFSLQANTTASYEELPKSLLEAKSLKAQQKTFSNYLYTSQKLELYACKSIKLESRIGQSQEEFSIDVVNVLKELKEEELEKLEKSYDVKFNRLEDKLVKLEIKLEKEKDDVSSKTTDTLLDIGLNVLAVFFGKKTLSTAALKRGASTLKKGKGIFKERTDVKNVESLIQDIEVDIEDINSELQEEIQNLQDKFSVENYKISPFYITPRRTDITIKEIALLWER